MKTQIRKGVFETNSSSTHALVLKRDLCGKTVIDMLWELPEELRAYIQNNGIHFGKLNNSWDWCEEKNLDESIKEFGEKLDHLWEIVMSMDLKYVFRFMRYCSHIKSNYYINYDINISEEYLDCKDMYCIDSAEKGFVADHILDSQEHFERFVFSESYLTEFDNNKDPEEIFKDKNIDIVYE